MVLNSTDYVLSAEKEENCSWIIFASGMPIGWAVWSWNLLALMPHTPGHGSLHLLLTHALDRSHSVFWTHSGRQPVYGSPKYSERHAHEPTPFRSLQMAFAPHGDGWHGFTSTLSLTGGTLKVEKFSFKICWFAQSRKAMNFDVLNDVKDQ